MSPTPIAIMTFTALSSAPAAAQVVGRVTPAAASAVASPFFGYTSPSDMVPPKAWIGIAEPSFRIGKRDGRYVGIRTKLAGIYGVSEALSVGGAVTVQRLSIEGQANLGNLEKLVFEGFSANLKWRLRKRTARGLGLSLEITPQWTPANPISGVSQDSFLAEMKATAELPIIADRLFVGANAKITPATTRDAGKWNDSALLELSIGIAAAAKPGTVGVELRRLSGRNPDSRAGRAIYFGPTASLALPGNILLAVTGGVQFSGRSKFDPGRNLDLVSFERYQGFVRLSFPL